MTQGSQVDIDVLCLNDVIRSQTTAGGMKYRPCDSSIPFYYILFYPVLLYSIYSVHSNEVRLKCVDDLFRIQNVLIQQLPSSSACSGPVYRGRLGNDRDQRQKSEAADLGHRRAGEFPNNYEGSSLSVAWDPRRRRHEQRFIPPETAMAAVDSGQHDHVSVRFVGNKCGMDRSVQFEDARALADEFGVEYCDISAKT
jgi:hypothetical protein